MVQADIFVLDVLVVEYLGGFAMIGLATLATWLELLRNLLSLALLPFVLVGALFTANMYIQGWVSRQGGWDRPIFGLLFLLVLGFHLNYALEFFFTLILGVFSNSVYYLFIGWTRHLVTDLFVGSLNWWDSGARKPKAC